MKIKNIRIKAGLTQSELAELSNISLRTICAFEQGTRIIDNANISLVITLANALNCKIEDILENKDNIKKIKAIYK